MRVEETTVDPISSDEKQWYGVGGIAALVLGIGYIIIFPLYAHVGALAAVLPVKAGKIRSILRLPAKNDSIRPPLNPKAAATSQH